MRGPVAKLWVAALIFILFICGRFPAASATSPDLYIREINITGNEFIALQANSAISDLSDYWLGYVNDNQSLAAPSEQLPAIALGAGQVVLLSSSTQPVCDANYVAKLPFSSGFSNSKGAVALWGQSGTSFSQLESVTWGSTHSPTILIATESHISPSATNAVWYNDGTENWIVGDLQSCTLNNAIDQSNVSQTSIAWPAGAGPPVTIVSTANSGSAASIPAADVGLSAPQINEILPNPASPSTDADDEFIELYNPNDSTFDLSGFTLEIGLTTKHDFTFDQGTIINGKSFKAFYSADTHLSLSNSGSQVWLLDPLGTIISQTEAYGSADDGMAWALANGAWYWTSTPTPDAANLINGQPASSIAKSKTKTTPTVTASTGKSSQGSNAAFDNSSGAAIPAPIHPWTLAGVGSAALLYAGYEYRNDLARHVYRIRRYAVAPGPSRK